MVPKPTYSGRFDATLSPVVVITGPSGVVATLPAALARLDEMYHVNWHTKDYALDASKTYRISVFAENQELGYADVDVVDNGRRLKNVNTEEYIPLLDGRTLPIKFRIEVGAVSQPGLTGVETRITTDLADQMDPAISGDIIVYTDYRGADVNIWYFNLDTGQETPVTTAPGDQVLNDVSGNTIVFDDYNLGDVWAFDVTLGTSTNLTGNEGHGGCAQEPAVGGALVAWASGGDIYARDLTTNTDRQVSSSTASDRAPAVGSGTIVWQACNPTCHIWAYDWDANTARQLTSGTEDERDPDVWGTKVVFSSRPATGGAGDIVLFDLATNTSTRLVLDADQANPNISGNYVVFEDMTSGVSHLTVWDLSSGGVYPVPAGDGSSQQFLNDIDGNRIVYTDDRNGQYDVYMFTFTIGAPGSTVTICDRRGGLRRPKLPCSHPRALGR
jgi:beta propeller repeat protein